MTSFLVEKKASKSFEEKIAKLAVKTRQNINAAKNSFSKFCYEYYDGRSEKAIFEELKVFDQDERNQAVRDVLQAWIDWQYTNDSLTTSVKQYISKIKRILNHEGIKYHIEDFDEPLEYKAKIKEELHELTLDEIQKIFAVAVPRKVGFYLALISTGARPGELLQVRKKDITFGKRIKIRIEAENVKTRSGRSVWLINEAAGFLIV